MSNCYLHSIENQKIRRTADIFSNEKGAKHLRRVILVEVKIWIFIFVKAFYVKITRLSGGVTHDLRLLDIQELIGSRVQIYQLKLPIVFRVEMFKLE